MSLFERSVAVACGMLQSCSSVLCPDMTPLKTASTHRSMRLCKGNCFGMMRANEHLLNGYCASLSIKSHRRVYQAFSLNNTVVYDAIASNLLNRNEMLAKIFSHQYVVGFFQKFGPIFWILGISFHHTAVTNPPFFVLLCSFLQRPIDVSVDVRVVAIFDCTSGMHRV